MMLPEVLYLTSRMPYPPHSGGQLREYELLRRLTRRARVHLWVVTQFASVDTPGIVEMEKMCASVHLFPADATAPMSGTPSRVSRQLSAASTRELRGFLQTYPVDLVHVEGYYMVSHLPSFLASPLVLVEENVEYLLDRQSEQLGIASEPACTWQQAAHIERRAWGKARLCAAVSHDDARHMESSVPGLKVRWTPDGADHLPLLAPDCPRAVDQQPGEVLTVTFVGNFGYPPSADGASFLLDEVWPTVAAEIPDSRLLLVGTEPNSRMHERAAELPGVEVTGHVPSVAEVLDRSHVFVAPLRVGGGVKVKVLEAIARGCPIVSTEVGAQGLPPHVRDTLVVRAADELSGALTELLRDQARRLDLSTRMRQAARSLPTWDEAADHLWQTWTDALPTEPAPNFGPGGDRAGSVLERHRA